MAGNNVYDLMKRINKEAKKQESYNTGLIGEQLIIASYKQMPLDKLEKMRFIINKIIKEKKEFIRFANSQNNDRNKQASDGQNSKIEE
jgi:hypothetical protein